MIRYKVNESRIEEVKKIVREFVSRVKDKEPKIIVYEVYQLAKSDAEFVHFVKFEDEQAEKIHNHTDYKKKFFNNLKGSLDGKIRYIYLNAIY